MDIQADRDFSLIGNRSLWSRLLRDIREGRLNHAYILDGPVGSGRHTLAARLCGAVACQNRPNRIRPHDDQMGLFDDEPAVAPNPDAPLPCGVCLPCEKVLNGQCSDIHYINRDGKATLGVDAIRFLKQDVLIPPNDLDTKIYIIEDAETMTVQAQNALLLTLEEPPSYVLFLLLCNGADSLLETIRSRAPILRLQPIPDDDIRNKLNQIGRSLSENDMEAVLSRAAGSIGQAIALSDARSLKPILRIKAYADEFITACACRQSAEMFKCVNSWDGKRETVQDIMNALDKALRDLLLLKSSDNVTLLWYTDREAALDLSSAFSQRGLLRLIEAKRTAQEALDANGNVKLILTRMVLDIGA